MFVIDIVVVIGVLDYRFLLLLFTDTRY